MISGTLNREWSLEPFSFGGQLISLFMAGENGHSQSEPESLPCIKRGK